MKPKSLLYLLVLLALAFQGLQAQSFQVSFTEDTIFSCDGEQIILSPEISGGQAPFTFNWNISGLNDSVLYFTPVNEYSLIVVTVTDGLGVQGTDSMIIHQLPECVWPGDANGDAMADNLDLLPIGKGYGQGGYIRPNAHLNFIGQPAHSWQHSFQGGVNYAHADGNGDGWIDEFDIQAIEHNYFQPQTSGNVVLGNNAPPLYVDFPSGTYLPGDTITASIILGTQAFPASDIYGVAFSISYGGYLLDSGSVSIDYSNSWMGMQQVDMQSIDKVFYSENQVDIAITRIDQINANGYGQIADITVMIDEITGKKAGIEAIDFQIEHISLVNKNGDFLPVSAPSTQLFVLLGVETNIDPDEQTQKAWEIRQTNNSILVSQTANRQLGYDGTVKIFNLNGQKLMERSLVSQENRIRKDVFSKGCYILTIQEGNNVYSEKIFISE